MHADDLAAAPRAAVSEGVAQFDRRREGFELVPCNRRRLHWPARRGEGGRTLGGRPRGCGCANGGAWRGLLHRGFWRALRGSGRARGRRASSRGLWRAPRRRFGGSFLGGHASMTSVVSGYLRPERNHVSVHPRCPPSLRDVRRTPTCVSRHVRKRTRVAPVGLHPTSPPQYRIDWTLVPGAGLEPACRSSPARHFKCLVSTSFTTRAALRSEGGANGR